MEALSPTGPHRGAGTTHAVTADRPTGRPGARQRTTPWPALAGELLAVLDEIDAEGPGDCIGGSMGCATQLHAAVIAPQRFGRVVLVIPPTAFARLTSMSSRILVLRNTVNRTTRRPGASQ